MIYCDNQMQYIPHKQGSVGYSGDFGNVPQNQADPVLSSSLNFYPHSFPDSQEGLKNDTCVLQREDMQYVEAGEQDSNGGGVGIPISTSLTRKRPIDGPTGGWPRSGSYGSPDLSHLESMRFRDGVVEEPSSKVQRGFDTLIPDFSTMGSPDEELFLMDNDYTGAPHCIEEEDTMDGKVSSKMDVCRTVEEPDRAIFEACFKSNIQWLTDSALEKMDGLEISWVKPPAKKIRPSYNCEGSRGAIKTEDGASVEINVDLTSPLTEPKVAILIAACVTEGKGQKVEAHPHFQTSCVGEQSVIEQEIDGLSAICIKKELSSAKTKLKLDVGIKRKANKQDRTPKLNRKARVIFRLCLVEKKLMSGGEFYWNSAGWAQIITSTISLEQSQGPPSITELSTSQCTAEGKVTVAAKGKNLESKASKVEVVFSHKESGWRAKADVFHNVTTPQSLAFVVPPFRPAANIRWTSSKVQVTIDITVDGRKSDNEFNFIYVLPKHRPAPAQQPMQATTSMEGFLDNAEVASMLNDIDRSSNVHQMNAHQAAFDCEQFYQPPQTSHFNSWTKTEPTNSSCMGRLVGGKQEPQEWAQQERSMNDDVQGLSLNDVSISGSNWST